MSEAAPKPAPAPEPEPEPEQQTSETPATDKPAGPNLVGSFDAVEKNRRAAGWARNRDTDVKVPVEVLIDDKPVGRILADQGRSDMRKNGWGDCAFWFEIPTHFFDNQPHEIAMRFEETGEPLRNSPKWFTLAPVEPAPAQAAEPVATPEPPAQAASAEPAPAPKRAEPASGAAQSPAAAAPLTGHFDDIEESGWAAGWVRRAGSSERIALEAWIDGECVGTVTADQYRADLSAKGLEDCAFWFGIPEDFLDGVEHSLDFREAATQLSVPGSPRSFSIRAKLASQSGHGANVIGNDGFTSWPAGLSVRPRERFEEVVAGWYYDLRKGTSPDITISADKPADVALRRDAYAMRVTVASGGNDGYMRLVVPIAVEAAKLDQYRFSVGIRRPPFASDANLYVGEIFLGTVTKGNIERVSTIRRALKPKGTLRVANIPAVSDPTKLASVPEGATFALIIELKGDGELLLFGPSLTPGPSRIAADDDLAGDEFEDPQIRNQVESLNLSPIWKRARAVAAADIGAAPRPRLANQEGRALAAVPFIQIVVPVFNAAVDVEELLRSIIRNTDTPFEILIFDDGSAAFAQSRIGAWEALDPRVRFYSHPENIGYTSNINFALQSTVSDYVVLINSDTVVTPGWLRKLYQVMVQDERIAGVGPLSNAASWQSIPRTKGAGGEWVVNTFDKAVTPERVAALLEDLYDGATPEFPLLNGFCTLFRKSALEDIGYFDDASFPKGYGEENDLCLRLGKRGWSLRVAPDTYVHHSKSKSFGVSQRKELSKAANQILRGKHPEVNFVVIEERMQTDPTVNRIRQLLSRMLGIEPAP